MSAATKTPYSVVRPVADRIVEALTPYCERIELAGSLRRKRPHIGDIEIVAVPRPRVDLFGVPVKGPTPLDIFFAEKGVEFSKNGDRLKQFQYGRYTVDLFLPTAETWGSIFTIRTGSAAFSKWLVTSELRGGAAPNGIIFHEGRLYAHGRRLATPEEADVFAALGLYMIQPAGRDGPIPEAELIRSQPVWNYE